MDMQGIYDMVGFKPDKQDDAFQDIKLKKAIEQNKNLSRRNKDMFEESDECYMKCPRYNPCAICDKCQNKASHLYVKCQLCQIPICTHKHKDRNFMIKRKNFEIKVTQETLASLRGLSEEARKVGK